MTGTAPAALRAETNWRALNYFNGYRLLVALLFVALYWIGQLPEPLGVYDPRLFALAAHGYLAAALGAVVPSRLKIPRYKLQVAGLVLMDVIAITMLMYASDGLSSGFGMLLVIVVAGGALLAPGKIGILFAAIAAIAVLGHEGYLHLNRFYPKPNFTHAGFLGITFFVTAFVSNTLASRVRASEALAAQRGLDLQNLARLNEYIVQQLQSGILVLDGKQRITLINEAARALLAAPVRSVGLLAREIAPFLTQSIQEWRALSPNRSAVSAPGPGGTELQVSIMRLPSGSDEKLLIFLEDAAVLRQRAQQMKLASLGRLTASIAHEVRNPLGAISHASQLLAESLSAEGKERRLTSIIEENSRRVNGMIENVLGLSRRAHAQPQSILLNDQVARFAEELRGRNKLEAQAVVVQTDSGESAARMDPDQLFQILWNLCENGLRYSRRLPLLVLKCGVSPDSRRPFVEVIDSGPGVASESREQLFEPFFTTEPRGTGLGLYIARELCEANQAALQLAWTGNTGTCFRILFMPPERRDIAA
ncbi:MAG: PAS domain-containing protein [Gammaproteobacteria bacterium]|nr:PAS domain-containing protein [Gammaproteobacteria bacterium]